jgi:hypothetical protein
MEDTLGVEQCKIGQAMVDSNLNQETMGEKLFCSRMEISAFRWAYCTTWVGINDVSTTMILQLQQFMSQEREFAEPQNACGNPSLQPFESHGPLH